MEKIVTDSKFWKALANLLLLLTSIVTAGQLLFLCTKGGILLSEFRQVQKEIIKIEQQGSPLYSDHVKLDDMRQRLSDERWIQTQRVIDMVPKIETSLAVIASEIKGLKEVLDAHSRQTEKQP